MKNFIISVESACDLDEAIIKENNIKVCPMEFTINDKTILSSNKDFSSKMIVDLLKKGANIKTTQINEYMAEEYLNSLLKEGVDILHISFSSAMSNTVNNFISVAKRLNENSANKVYVVDSLCQSGGVGLLVKMLIDEINLGKIEGVEEARKYVENVKLNIAHVFTVDNLKFLAKSGRVRTPIALIGNLLQIKPILKVNDEGAMIQIKKTIGRKKSIRELFEIFKQTYLPITDDVMITNADCEEDAQTLKQMITESFKVNVSIVPLNPVVAVHGGPASLALFYTTSKR